jgi:hypothetical protein
MADGKPIRRVWLFMADGRNVEDLRDLEHLDGLLWGSNPHTRQGDLVLMYRTAPYSDIAYVFQAISDPRPTRREDGADTTHVVQLGHKVALATPIAMETLRSDRRLRHWPFVKFARGHMRWRDDLVAQGVWPALHALIARRNRGLDVQALQSVTDSLPTFRWGRLRVFFSYAHADRRRVRHLYRRVGRLRGVDVWRDDERLGPGVQWGDTIEAAIDASDVVIICLSRGALRRGGYVGREIDLALRAADERTGGGFSVIPVKLEECRPEPRLRRWQWVTLSDRRGLVRVVDAIRARARSQRSRRP